MKILIIGNGYIGARCAKEWADAIVSDKKIQNTNDVLELLDLHKPDAVLNAAGVVGKPNVDWCETHQLETVIGNTVLPIQIAEACQKRNIYLLHLGTGCIYYGYSADVKGWKEYDPANPEAVYTKTKYAADLAISTLANVGIARLRMPTDYVPHPANLIGKLASYKKVVDVENSLTIMVDLVLALRGLIEKKGQGIFHVTNPGSIRHKEIMALYKKYVDPTHENIWITEQELVEFGLAAKKRSNNIMQSPRLAELGIKMRPVKEAMEETMKKYAELVNK